MKVKLSPDSELPTTVGILAKTRGKMTTAITFSRQNDAGSCVSNTQHWENLVLVVVLISESKALYCLLEHHPSSSELPQGVTPMQDWPSLTRNLKLLFSSSIVFLKRTQIVK